jgi:hypothetical protein
LPRLTLELAIRDVHGEWIVDPRVQVRLGPPDGIGTVSTTVALSGAPVRLEIADGPAGPALFLRVTPSMYRDGAVACAVDGDGSVVPRQALTLPRRPTLWQPAFTPWRSLGTPFTSLCEVLATSPSMRVGQFSSPVSFVNDAFDAVDMQDESRALAKLCLLNLHVRLRDEAAPGLAAPWFAGVRELLLATRERLIAEVDETLWAAVRDLAARDRGTYRRAQVALHLDNFRAIPGVSAVSAASSVKTTERKGNLQFSVARVTRDGRPAFLLDCDIDENGGLLLHTFDLIRHAFTGGTHPVDVHECLCVAFPETDRGYHLVPMSLLPAPRALVQDAARRARRGARGREVVPHMLPERRRAARKR